MAAPTNFNNGAVDTGAAADIAPTLPASYAANDIFILAVECARGDSQSDPTGGLWTPHPSNPSLTTTAGTGPTKLYLYARIAAASSGEVAPTVPATGDHHLGKIFGIRGADVSGGSVWDFLDVAAGISNAASTASVSVGGVTTVSADCLVLYIIANGTDTGTAQYSAWANATLAGFGQLSSNNTGLGDGGGIGVGSGTKAVAGGTGTCTVTLASASKHCWFVLAIKPTAASPGVATPATVAGVGAVPAPTAIGAGAASPIVVQGVAAVPAPVAKGAAVATPAVVAGIGAVPAPTVLAPAVASPAVVAGVGAVPAPTAKGAAAALPATVAGIGAVPAPTAKGAGSASPATVAGVGAVPAPSIVIPAIAQPATVEGIGDVPDPTIYVPPRPTVGKGIAGSARVASRAGTTRLASAGQAGTREAT